MKSTRAYPSAPLALLVLAFALASAVSYAQDASPAPTPAPSPSAETLSLEQALAEAAKAGPDFLLIEQNLALARTQRSLDLAKQGIGLSANGGYTLADGLGGTSTSLEQSLTSKAEAAAGASLGSSQGIAQSAQAGLSLSAPLTKAALSASHTIPAPTPAATPAPSPRSGAAATAVQSNDQSSSFGLTLTQTLWDGYPGGQYRATLAKSRLALQGKELAAATSRSAAVSKVKQAYVTMLAAQRDLGIKQQALARQRLLLTQVKAVYALQQATQIDLKTAQINAASAELDAATADKTLRLANQRLAVAIGRPGNSRFAVADVSQPPLPAASVDEAIKIGLDKRADLAQYRITASSARIDADLAKAQAQPTVLLSGGAGIAVSWAAAPVYGEALSLGAKLTLPVIDSGTAAFQAETSLGQAKLADTQAQQLAQTAANDIQDSFESAQLLLKKVDLAKQSADLADEQFELMKAQNQHGTATTQDLLAASVAAATAEAAYGTAMNAYLLAELALETAMGL